MGLVLLLLTINFRHTLALHILPPFDQQSMRYARHNDTTRWAVFPIILVYRRRLVAKYPGQKFKNTIDCILMLLVSLSRSHSLLPQMLIGRLQIVQIGRYCCLMPLNRRNTANDRVNIQDLTGGQVTADGGGPQTRRISHLLWLFVSLRGLFFALDEA